MKGDLAVKVRWSRVFASKFDRGTLLGQIAIGHNVLGGFFRNKKETSPYTDVPA